MLRLPWWRWTRGRGIDLAGWLPDNWAAQTQSARQTAPESELSGKAHQGREEGPPFPHLTDKQPLVSPILPPVLQLGGTLYLLRAQLTPNGHLTSPLRIRSLR